MDKNAIKKYAVWARRELIARVTQKAEQYEITADKITPADAESIGGRLLTDAEKNQRRALIRKIETDGFEQVMEEVAYTWFNRFTALRFMEVNNYLPSYTRVFTNENNEFKPQILTDAIQLDLDGLNMDKVLELKDANKTEELYKYLLITQCNALNSILPRMFQKIEDYTELLLPDYLLREGSVIEQMITLIPEEDWTDQVQIIGWLYQYYNTEPKDKVFADLKKNVKITKENIPAATQLFTPDWIVRYMVENSLGRLWLEGHPNDKLKSEWKYYLDEAEQELDVQIQLEEIRKEYATMKPEEIRCIDPCMGSGHILCYMFDVLVKIYEEYGYTARDAAACIVDNNLWGLDIDERAAQLAYFAVMMKARQYDRRFFTRKIQPHVYAIEESNGITSAMMFDMGQNLKQDEYGEAVKQTMRLIKEMHDAKEYGSIIHVTPCNWDLLHRFAVPREEDGQMHLDFHGEIEASTRLQEIINIGEILAQEYDVVVTNPPYMGTSGMSSVLSDYLKEHYPDGKSDLFAVFMKKCSSFTKTYGMYAMITMHSWMFLQSFYSLRKKILSGEIIVNMLHLGSRSFSQGDVGTIVQTTSFVCQKAINVFYKGLYCRLIDYLSPEEKQEAFLAHRNEYTVPQVKYNYIPGQPLAYWASENLLEAFNETKLGDIAKPRQGMATSNNNRFLRMWYEVDYSKTCFTAHNSEDALRSGGKWFPYNKGGGYRKWYGNNEFLVNWENDGYEIKQYAAELYGSVTRTIKNIPFYFRDSITWSFISINPGFRYCDYGFLFDVGGSSIFIDEEIKLYTLAFLCSIVCKNMLEVINPTMNIQANDIKMLPLIVKEEKKAIIEELANDNIIKSKEDWDIFETSWGFKTHPLISRLSTIRESFKSFARDCDNRYEIVEKNERQLNKEFIAIYNLKDCIFDDCTSAGISIRKSDLERDVRSLLSYAVGCMFGRYSVDTEGLCFAGGEWDDSNYKTIIPDKDNILPICDDEYFEDDIVGMFIDFIRKVYGEETLEENLRFIADALGGKGTPREVIRNYFINGFYADHVKVYQKRPIYWLFDSGKKNGFKCLVYMHRYQPDTIARIRTDYVHEQQSRYRTAIADLEQRINNASTSEMVKLNKQLTKLQAQAEEIRVYEEKIHHLADQMISIDLDDGVKHNYALFQDVLAKIK